MEITYHREGDYLYPNLTLETDETLTIGKYGLLRKSYLKTHKSHWYQSMLMTGKLVSVTEDFKRDLLPDNMIWGQAAGTAAALCIKKGITPRELENCVGELQEQLRKDGAILDGVK